MSGVAKRVVIKNLRKIYTNKFDGFISKQNVFF